MTRRLETLLFMSLLLLLKQGTQCRGGPLAVPIRLSVENDLFNTTPESYSSHVVKGGVLLGALRRLQETQQHFKFTVKEDPDYGLILVSVNGVAGSEAEQTYWEILSEVSGEYTRLDVGEYVLSEVSGEYTRLAMGEYVLSEVAWEYTTLDVGIGCYKPKANDHIILRLSKWSKH